MKNNIAIIGAGVSGLVAAIKLEKLGYEPTIYETNIKVGGRVQSDSVEGYVLDHGFQVLLNAYPLAQKYLDYTTLSMKSFEPGSYIFKKNKQFCIGDPLRDLSLLFETLFSKIGTLSDKLKIIKLTNRLKSKTINQIFESKEFTTIDYLTELGFSKQFIVDFFTPFFGGIFLENDLQTSSRMFEFIFKMFSEGEAVIPKKGIQEIPNQLASKLKKTKIEFSKAVEKVIGGTIHFLDGEIKKYNYIIVATDASKLIPQLASQKTKWKSTYTLYFEVKKVLFDRYMIGLVADSDNLINSICFPQIENLEAKNKLLSVSVIKKHQLSDENLVSKITNELKDIFGIEPIKHLKTYFISKALPVLNDVRMTMNPSETQLTEHIFLAGDILLNGSLNAAMHSGELAAEAVNNKITGTILI